MKILSLNPTKLLTTATNVEDMGPERHVESKQKLQYEQGTEEGRMRDSK